MTIVNRFYQPLYHWSIANQEDYATQYHCNSKTIRNEALYLLNSLFLMDRSLMVFISNRLTLSALKEINENQMPSVWNHWVPSAYREQLLSSQALRRLQDGTAQFRYHRQEPKYVHSIMEQKQEADQLDHSGQIQVDQNLKDSGSCIKVNVKLGPVVQFGMNA